MRLRRVTGPLESGALQVIGNGGTADGEYLTIEEGGLMRTQDLSLHVDVESGALCEFMANPENERFWNPDLIEIRRIGDRPVAPGAEWEARYKGMGVNRIRLEEHERPTRVVFETTGERMDMRLVFTFSPDGDGTRAHAHTEMRPKGVMRLLAPLMMPMVKRNFSKRPAQLKAGFAASQSTQPARTPAE